MKTTERRTVEVESPSLRNMANVTLSGGTAFRDRLNSNLKQVRTKGSHIDRANVTTAIGSLSYRDPGTTRSLAGSPDVYSSRLNSTNQVIYGSERDLGTDTIVDDRMEYIERQIPKRVLTEKKVKKRKVVPTDLEEEIQKDQVIEIKEKIIEVAPSKKMPPVVKYNDIVKERKVKRREVVERKVPRTIYKEKIVEGSEVEYVEVPTEKIIEIPQYQEELSYHHVPIPQYVDHYVPKQVDVMDNVDIHRRIPVPVEAVTEYSFDLPTLKPKYKRKELPIYAPRFVEVPVPAELMDDESQQMALHMREQIHLLASQEAPSLIEVEKISRFAKEANFQSHISCSNYQEAIENAWRNKQLTVQNGMLQSVGQHAGGVSVRTFGQPI